MTRGTFVTFTPGPPKPAESVTAQSMRYLITDTNKPTSAKSVGSGVVLVYMSGPKNYYATHTHSLTKLLAKHNIEI